MEKHQKYNESVDAANQMMEEAESSANKRVKFVPIFLNVFGSKSLQNY